MALPCDAIPDTDRVGQRSVTRSQGPIAGRSRGSIDEPKVLDFDRVVGYCSVMWQAEGSSSLSTRGYAGARSVLTSAVDDLAELVDRPMQIDPPPGDFDLRLIDEPPTPEAWGLSIREGGRTVQVANAGLLPVI